jgi:hypothetical protein
VYHRLASNMILLPQPPRSWDNSCMSPYHISGMPYFFKWAFWTFLSLSSYETPIMQMLAFMTMSHKSHIFSSCISLLFFFSSDLIFSNDLSLSSQIPYSAWLHYLLLYSIECFISFIGFFTLRISVWYIFMISISLIEFFILFLCYFLTCLIVDMSCPVAHWAFLKLLF